MKISEARDFIDRLYDAEGGMTEDMREDLRRLHDSEDEQEGMDAYWKRHEEKLDALSNQFNDFRKAYVEQLLTPREARRAHERDLRDDDFSIETAAEKAKRLLDNIIREDPV